MPSEHPQGCRQGFQELKDEISEDELADLQDDLQKETDKKIKEIDKAIEAKTKEVMTV